VRQVAQAIINRLQSVKGNSAWSLVSGRIYRAQVPKAIAALQAQGIAAGAYPHILLTGLGGTLLRVYPNAKGQYQDIELPRFQVEVYDEYGEDGSRAWTIWDQFVRDVEYKALLSFEQSNIMARRAVLPREIVESYIIQIVGDWELMRQREVAPANPANAAL
jgi:hypothetical protein